MSYGLADAEATDAQKVAALEKQAADLDKIAAALELAQPAAAQPLKNQAVALRQQAVAFKGAAGIEDGYFTKPVIGGLIAGLALGILIGRASKP